MLKLVYPKADLISSCLEILNDIAKDIGDHWTENRQNQKYNHGDHNKNQRVLYQALSCSIPMG